MANTGLTPSQQTALFGIKTWWTSSDKNLILSGMPGTGKTYLIQRAVESLIGAVPLYTATTNEAVRQLAIALGNKTKPRTTYSALGLAISTRSFKQSIYQKSLPADFYDYNLLIVDECSMAGMAQGTAKKLELIDYVLASGMRCIWLGDWAQLPPIDSTDGKSPIFSLGFPTLELTEVKRHSGMILNWAVNIRNTLAEPVRNLPKSTEGLGIKPKGNPMAFALDEFNAVVEDKARILVWTNTQTEYSPQAGVLQYNQYIRSRLFGYKKATESSVYPTDKLLFSSPFFVCANPEKLTHVNLLDTEFHIQACVNVRAEVIRTEKASLLGFEVWRTDLELESGRNVVGFIPTNRGAIQKRLFEDALVKEALAEVTAQKRREFWHFYHTFRGAFTEVKHTYCITGHRGQGSNIEHVFVSVANILQNTDRLIAFKNLYVCATRAEKKLTLIL